MIVTEMSAPEIMRDGAVLSSADSDTFQILLASSVDAYVYVYAVDSTAWIQRLYPDAERGHQNPVPAGAEILLPRPEHYFGLDEYKGTEEIWFLASPEPREEGLDHRGHRVQ